MKKSPSIITVLLVLPLLQVHSQNLEGNHTYRIGDKVEKQLVEYELYDESAKNVVWDLRDLSDLDRKHKVVYTDVYNKEQLVAGVENNALTYYEQRNDSLVSWGYEDNLTKVEYDCPVLLLKTPLVYGSRHEGLFHGTYAYCERMFARIFGEYQVSVDGTGVMLLPSGDTLRHVSRVHLRESSSLRHYPELSTAKQLRAYADSLPFNNDSVRMAMALTPAVERNTYRWYAAGYRYPVLEVVETGQQGGGSTSVAYYCPPEEQLALYDEENEKVREQLAAIDNQNTGNAGQGDSQPSAMSRYDVSVNGQTITIDYDLTEGATVKGLVCNVMGMVFRQQSQTHGAGEHYQMQLDCTGLRRGEYVLYLNVNGQVTSSTVSL